MSWGFVAATAVSSGVNYMGSRNQADAAERGAKDATDAQLAMYEQTREDYAPWREGGVAALNQQLQLLGLSPTQGNDAISEWQAAEPKKTQLPLTGFDGLNRRLQESLDTDFNQARQDWMDSAPGGVDIDGETGEILSRGNVAPASTPTNPTDILRSTPGYQFQLEEGMKARERAASASGRLYSGSQLKELTRYSQGLADQTFGDYFNRLGVIAGTGQTATRDTASLGHSTAGNLGNIAMQGGQIQGQHAINTANVGTNLMNNFADIYATKNFNMGGGSPGSSRSDYTGAAMRNWVGNQ